MKTRLLIQLDEATEDRIRLLSFQTHTPLVEIIRQCVDRSLDDVGAFLLQKPGVRLITTDDIRTTDYFKLNMKAIKPEGTGE
jgi:hypothetical protein